MTNIDRDTLQAEVDKNYQKFKGMKFPIEQKGKYALMRHEKVVEIMDTKRDAHRLAKWIFADGVYSIQEIHAKPMYPKWV